MTVVEQDNVIGASASIPRLRLNNVSKTFLGTRALDDVSLSLDAGEIHALVGQNGAGKSTLIKILSGYYSPDAGTIEANGRRCELPLTPQSAAAIGLRFVHQNLALIPATTVLEAIRAGNWTGQIRPISWSREERIVTELLSRLNADIDPHATIVRLSPSQRAIVAIVRALQDVKDGGSILALDEPTASLNRVDAERLFAALRSLRDDGHTILFVSHRLDEVLAIADRVTVVRDGRRVITASVSTLTEEDLIRAIVGRDIRNLYPEPTTAGGRPVLRVQGMSGSVVHDFELLINAGEIVGITGLAGMGQDELPYLIFGAAPRRAGKVEIEDVLLAPPTPAKAIAAGMALVPADRERVGSIRTATVSENITMGTIRDFFRGGRLRRSSELTRVQSLLGEFDVHPPRPDFAFGALSGGNQQKALLAKWLQRSPKVLLLHEPSQGVDIGSRQQVFRIIKRTAESGSAVAIFSVEYGDLAHLCNRVVVLRDGSVSGELSGTALDEGRLLQACMRSGV